MQLLNASALPLRILGWDLRDGCESHRNMTTLGFQISTDLLARKATRDALQSNNIQFVIALFSPGHGVHVLMCVAHTAIFRISGSEWCRLCCPAQHCRIVNLSTG